MYRTFLNRNILNLRTIYLYQFNNITVCNINTTFTKFKKSKSSSAVKQAKKILKEYSKKKSIEDLIKPLNVESVAKKFEPEHVDGLESLNQSQISDILNDFLRRPIIRQLATENGLSEKIFMSTFKSFRKMCIFDQNIDIKIKLYLSDIHNKKTSPDILFESFLEHAKQVYPHLESLEDLKITSDLTQPHNWYVEARKNIRKIIFHAGPTNSGKTYQALERFKNAKSGIYCGPLRLLAHEVFNKTNSAGIPCDLLTGEDRRFAIDSSQPANHISCTVEMLSVDKHVEVCVIDEIQMVRDSQRGNAFTRALLGVPADEVHLCGETAAINIIKKVLEPIGEHVEICEYNRKTPLEICDYSLNNISNVQKGDVIVCFSKRDVYKYTKTLNELKIPCAIIYGQLPPKTKLRQAEKFNNPNDPTKVLVSTDAIGMGLNLNIGRVIFSTLHKSYNTLLPNYAALQIAGRAGRFGTEFNQGKVLCMYNKDLKMLNELLTTELKPIEKCGIGPTFEQIETFSYHLPKASLYSLLEIFESICKVSDVYFLCDIEDIKKLALLIDFIDMPLKDKYMFCLTPLKTTSTAVTVSFVKIVRRFASGQKISHQWFCDLIQYPFKTIKNEHDLMEFSEIYELIIAYLWLSYRFPDMFPDYLELKEMEIEADKHIRKGLEVILK